MLFFGKYCIDSTVIYPHFIQDCYSGKRKVNKIKLLHYLIHMLLPVLKQVNHDHSIELESEAMVTGIGDFQ